MSGGYAGKLHASHVDTVRFKRQFKNVAQKAFAVVPVAVGQEEVQYIGCVCQIGAGAKSQAAGIDQVQRGQVIAVHKLAPFRKLVQCLHFGADGEKMAVMRVEGESAQIRYFQKREVNLIEQSQLIVKVNAHDAQLSTIQYEEAPPRAVNAYASGAVEI